MDAQHGVLLIERSHALRAFPRVTAPARGSAGRSKWAQVAARLRRERAAALEGPGQKGKGR